jgi:hypothetical protein
LFDPNVVLVVRSRRGELWALNDRGSTVQFFEHEESGRFRYTIMARSRQRKFSFAEDLSSAGATGIGPYFDGALSFSATSEAYPGSFDGRVRGDFRVKLAVPGPFTLPPAAAFLGTISP